MAYDGLITSFLGQGLAADRQVALTIHPDAIGLYFATDTGELSLFADGDWIEDVLAPKQEWAPNFTAAGDVYIPADQAMTIDQGSPKIGTGTITFQKSTAAAPSTFSSATLPATLEAGAWLKVSAASVTGFVATHLKRTA